MNGRPGGKLAVLDTTGRADRTFDSATRELAGGDIRTRDAIIELIKRKADSASFEHLAVTYSYIN